MRGHRLKLRRCFYAAILLLPLFPAAAAAQEAASDAPDRARPEIPSIERSPHNNRPLVITPEPSVGSSATPVGETSGRAPGESLEGGPWLEPEASYGSEEVTIPTTEGHVLAGTLTLPSRPRVAELNDLPPDGSTMPEGVPAMVLVTGSGRDNRDAAPRWMPGYQPFWQIADQLTRRGIAVLRLDDRGVGSSSGEFEKATMTDFAGDVRNALAYLRARPDIDGQRLGVLGHSEGGVVATMVAAEDPALKAVVLLGSPGTNLRSIVAYQLRYWLEQDPALPFASRERMLVQQLSRWDVVADANPRLKFSRTYDPIPAVERISAPVLILHGRSDRQVPPKHAEKLAKALAEGGNHDVTVDIIPNVDHLFLQDKSGNPAGYRKLTSRRIPGPVLEEIGEWLAGRLSLKN
jgi:hypothetical protein